MKATSRQTRLYALVSKSGRIVWNTANPTKTMALELAFIYLQETFGSKLRNNVTRGGLPSEKFLKENGWSIQPVHLEHGWNAVESKELCQKSK